MFNFLKRSTRVNAEEINHEQFTSLLSEKKSGIVVAMTGWCGACKMQKPLIHDLANHHKDSDIEIVLINIDEEQEFAQQYSIRSIPTTLIISGGGVAKTHPGILTRRNLEDIIVQLKANHPIEQ